MLDRLRRFLKRRPTDEGAPVAGLPDSVPVEMAWWDGTRLPIADWERIGSGEPAGDDVQVHAYWNSAAMRWLEALGQALGPEYRLRHAQDFFLLSALPERQAQLFLSFCQRVLRKVRGNLAELADDSGYGRYVAIVFADQDPYYDYISHYFPDGGEYAMSSGVFLQYGYGHFALPEAGLEAMEPVIAHELTHSLLSHWPIPAWLNEGMAVNTEQALFPQLADPRAQLYRPDELAAQHAAYWDDASIQAFWSGKSFLRADEGSRLSYDLAAKITALAARDDRAFRAFVRHAHVDDAGAGAQERLGYPIAHLVDAVLGEGRWTPQPAQWREGVERGRFAGAHGLR